jgi:AhpD family alkylhydroperoxidase
METKEFLTKFQNDLEKKKLQANPSLNCFAGLFSKRMAQGELSVKMKELVAIGMAAAKQCEPCINLHVKKCLDTGPKCGTKMTRG